MRYKLKIVHVYTNNTTLRRKQRQLQQWPGYDIRETKPLLDSDGRLHFSNRE